MSRLDARRLSLVAEVLILLFLTACASYAPQPLTGADLDAVLRSPDRAVLIGTPAATPQVEPLDLSKPLSAEQIGVLAVLTNPELRAARLQLRIADAQIFAAGLLPDPQLSLGFDDVLAPGGQGLVTGLATSLSIDLLGALATRSVEREGQRAAREQVRLDLAWQEWSLAGEARMLAERLPRQQAAAALSRQAAAAAETSLQIAIRAAARGDLKVDELEARRIAASDAGQRAAMAARDATGTRLDLNHVLGLRPEEVLALAATAPLSPWQRPDPEVLFATARMARLDLQALAKAYDSQQAALHRTVLGQYPRLSISLNRLRDTSAVHTFGPAVTLDLPLWNRNRGEIGLARLDRERLRAEYAARLFQTRADIAALVSALDQDEAARAEIEAALPWLNRIAANFENAAARGDVTQTVAASARASVVDKQLAWMALEQSCAEQRLALTLATGQS